MAADLFPAGAMPPAEDILRILPEIVLAGTATVLMVMVPLLKNRLSALYGHISLVAMLAAMAAAVYDLNITGMAFSNLLIVDGFAVFFRVFSVGGRRRIRALVLQLPAPRSGGNRRIPRTAPLLAVGPVPDGRVEFAHHGFHRP